MTYSTLLAGPAAGAPSESVPAVDGCCGDRRRLRAALLSGLAALLLLSGGVALDPSAAEAAQHEVRPHGPVAAAAAGNDKQGPAPDPAVISAVRQAGLATGADTALLLAVARRESGFDAAARNRRSSARGLMQFTDATWLEAVRDFGPRHGLAREAAALLSAGPGRGGATRVMVVQVLRLRDDPRLAAVMAAERLESWRRPLEQAIGREMKPADLYFVHLLGPGGARRFLAELARAPARPAAAVVKRAAKANRGLFVQGGRTLTLAEVYRDVSRSLAATGAAPELTVERGPATVEVAQVP